MFTRIKNFIDFDFIKLTDIFVESYAVILSIETKCVHRPFSPQTMITCFMYVFLYISNIVCRFCTKPYAMR